MSIDPPDLPARVFIASSTASLPWARVLAKRLSPDIEADVWDTLFKPGDDTLGNLIQYASLYEFGVFVLTADDLTQTKDGDQFEPRDNVIFELGLFMGALGRKRAIAAVVGPADVKVKLPSDLAGNTYVKLDVAKLTRASSATGEIAPIREAISALATGARLSLLPGTSLAIGYFHNFLAPVGRLLRDLTSLETSGSTLDLSARGFDFTVLIPGSLRQAGEADRNRYVARQGLKSATVSPTTPSAAGRPYPVFLDDRGDGSVQVYDYPTTLRAADEAIRLILADRELNESPRAYALLADREIRTFANALRYLLGGQDGAVFSHQVKFRYV